MDICEALRLTRNESGRSQEYMAFELGVSRRTIQNWENGVSEPSLEQIMEWFRLTDKNPIPYLMQYVFPSMNRLSSADDDQKLRESLSLLIESLPPEGMRQLLYLFYGEHGSSPRAVLQMITAHLQTPMKDRVVQARVIEHNYSMAVKQGTVVRADHIQPDIDYLRRAIRAGEDAAVKDAKEYTV